jgi:hypothetical protein
VTGRARRAIPLREPRYPSTHLDRVCAGYRAVCKLTFVNRVPRWLLPAVLALLVLVVVIGSIIR